MPDQLRTELSIDTGLEKVVTAALAANRSVVIAGTAGSGKTHLIRTAGNLRSNYRVVSDLTALRDSDWSALFTQKSPVLVAGNEGAFHTGVRRGFVGFDPVVKALHGLQNGDDVASKGPVVIDVAGYDPAGSHAISKMLRLPILARYVETRGDPLVVAAWRMLSDENVCHRVALLVETASAQSDVDGFTFRQLWQFVADLVEGSNGVSATWFYRIFNGNSEVSKKIASCYSFSSLPLPHVGNHLWHLDLHAVRDHIVEASVPALEHLMPPSERDKTDASRRERLSILRQFCVFALRTPTVESRLNRPSNLWSQVRSKEHQPLLRAINHYMTYGMLGLGEDLELWIQHDTERRELKANVQISIGTAASSSLKLHRSAVIANRPPGCAQMEGGRLLLTHQESGSSLTITKDLVDGILRSRSHRSRDRLGVEYDWRLLRFFSGVAAQVARADNLKAAIFEFSARTGQLIKWQVRGQKIEKLAG
jgi:hypothetical protein